MSDLVSAEMPANIALIKYMGKIVGEDKNKPANPSFSFTLSNLVTRVELALHDKPQDEWQPLQGGRWLESDYSEASVNRYLNHFSFLKKEMGISKNYMVHSANNFPSDCGIASSASSFAALTQATYNLAKTLNPNYDISLNALADLSRKGSGSSIRSFIPTFALWDENGISEVEIPFTGIVNKVIIVSREKKVVGSSEAHQRILTSLLYTGRPMRAATRLNELLASLSAKDWKKSFDIVWAEFWDMHALFATSNPPFQYMTDRSMKVLVGVQKYWAEKKDGPLVTMDAGANVHLLYRADQKKTSVEVQQYLNEEFQSFSSDKAK